MEIIVFRHGIALDRDEVAGMGLSDGERPLTEKGRRRTRSAASGLKRVLGGGRVDSVICSPLLRARQTAELLLPYLEPASMEENDVLEPGLDPAGLDEWLHQRLSTERLVLVGHEPALSTWVAWGLTRKRERFLTLTKAGACLLEFPGHAEGGTGDLRWLLTAKQLRALG